MRSPRSARTVRRLHCVSHLHFFRVCATVEDADLAVEAWTPWEYEAPFWQKIEFIVGVSFGGAVLLCFLLLLCNAWFVQYRSAPVTARNPTSPCAPILLYHSTGM